MASLKELGLTKTFDCHTHSGGVDHYNFQKGILPFTQSVEDLILKTKLDGITDVITFPLPSTSYYNIRAWIETGEKKVSGQQDYPYQLENASFLLDCDSCDAQIYPFLCVDPSNMANKQIDYLEKEASRRRIFGLKLHTLAASATATELISTGFVDFAVSHNIPILVHSGLEDPYSHPYNAVKLAKQFPELRVCIAHLARFDSETLETVSKTDNLFVDCSPFLQLLNIEKQSSSSSRRSLIDFDNPEETLLRYYSSLKDHLVWGSDEPWTKFINPKAGYFGVFSHNKEVEVLLKLAGLSMPAVESILYKNPNNFLFG
jgi:predicted TIM-barrel fold metal-dependent hydrolase